MEEMGLNFEPPAFRAIVLMCDAVKVSEKKLFILGGGLGVVGPGAQQISLAIRIAVPWDQANARHDWTVALTDEDGQEVVIADKKIGLNGQFEAGRPAGIAPGSELWVPLAINFGPLPLDPGKRFTWTLTINGETSEHWTARFSTRPEKPKKV